MKKAVYFILIVLSYSSCKKTEDTAPAINDIYAPVVVTQAFNKTLANPNFSANNQEVFTAQFAKATAWTITLTGQTSHAVKTIKGISQSIDASNAVWEGYADAPPSFKAENVTAKLTFDNYPQDTFTTNLTIAA
ncbi:MAG TPA: hypothetical protein VK750_06080, partial [Cytophagaceae bacterium]|nr:hypothetical protein [Cytophagaceae bacterium]